MQICAIGHIDLEALHRHVEMRVDPVHSKSTLERATAENETGDACASAHIGKAVPVRD